MLAVKGSTGRRKDPACGTCRKKCRRCDRARPICGRCSAQGLHCEGYPPRFQFADASTACLEEDAISPSLSTSTTIVAAESTSSVDVRMESDPGIIDPSESEEPLPPAAGNSTGGSSKSPIEMIPPTSPSTSLSPSVAVIQTPLGQTAASSPLHEPTMLSIRAILNSTDGSSEPREASTESRDKSGNPFQLVLSEALTVSIGEARNPFREHLLPLAYQHDSVMHALLGLTACHMYNSGKDSSQRCLATSLQHRVAALQSLGSLLTKEQTSGLMTTEEEAILATVLLLVTHDICETGISSHGTHLTGMEPFCSRIARLDGHHRRSKSSMFLVSALTWLDLLRGFSGAEKLTYSADVRACVRDHGSLSLHCLVGCPPAIFYRIGIVLQAAKDHMVQRISFPEFQQVLHDAERFLRVWDPDQVTYPTEQKEWRHLAEAFRHACLLRVMRFPDAFTVSCTDPRIQESVAAILDVSAQMPRDSVFYKRLLFPLFLAGADTASPHQIHYTSWCISEIKQSTGFQHPAMTELLTNVWDERKHQTRGWNNVPWMEFVSLMLDHSC
ncbi:hypothetical protein S40288_06882 [Stachybotrys chartarum IBT 40288]|nr:hypothetical protein S40288_06882 [Stachybotrys chartarum IBT 40288]